MESVLLNNGGEKQLKLDGHSNWVGWKFQVGIILNALELLEVTNGTAIFPVDGTAQDKETWKKKDAKAQSLIVTRMSNKTLMQITCCKTANEMWKKLHTIYEQKSEGSLHLMQQKFFDLKYKYNEDMACFIGRIEHVVNQVKQLNGEIPETMVVTKIITALPEEYRHFASAWESAPKEKQTLNELTARLLTEQQRIKGQNNEITEALTAKIVNQRKCFKCGKLGHYKKDCFSGKKPLNKVCSHCNKSGHSSEACWFKKRYNQNKSRTENAFMVLSTAGYSKYKVSDDWYADSGASEHMSHSKEMKNYQEFKEPKKVMIGDGSTIEAFGSGTVELEAFNGKEWVFSRMENVLYIPSLKVNLFSIRKAFDKGYQLQGDKTKCQFIKDECISAIATRKENMFIMDFRYLKQKVNSSAMVSMGKIKSGISEWHSKMAHQNMEQVKTILKRNEINFNMGDEESCIPCLKGKQHKMPFSSSKTITEKPGDLLHMDLCGPMNTVSYGGAKYFLLIKDDYSRFRIVYFLRNKFETTGKIKTFMKEATNQGHIIKKVRSDNGKEFTNAELKRMYNEYGIIHQTSIPYTPEQNGKIERENRTVIEAARTMLAAKNLNKQLWAEAVNTAVFVLNRTGKSCVPNKTPHELWHNTTLYDVSMLEIFGSLVSVHIPDHKRYKWDDKSEIGIFVGYGEKTKGFRVFMPETEEVRIERNVIFIKDSCRKVEMDETLPYNQLLYENNNNDHNLENEQNENNNEENNLENVPETEEQQSSDEGESDIDELNSTSDTIYHTEDDEENLTSGEENVENLNVNQREQRLRRAPSWLNQYETNFLSSQIEPATFEEAMIDEDSAEWKKAIDTEMKTLKLNETWSEVKSVPKGNQVINTKWVFKLKQCPDGSIQHKARLVARGFEQKLEDSEVYTPVARMTTFRVLMAVATQKKLSVYQMDVTGAFLYGEIKEKVYIKLPNGGFGKLNKSLYGLKNSPKRWYEKFHNFMLENNFKRSKNDFCLYIGSLQNVNIYLLIYVDDLLLFGSSNEQISEFKRTLCNNFQMKDLGLATMFLGISIKQNIENKRIILNQTEYLKKVLDKFLMSDCKEIKTPIEQNFKHEPLQREKSESEYIENKCRKLIGNLLYACSGTRPDLCVAVSLLSRFQHCASKALYTNLKRVLRYIKGTLELSLVYNPVEKSVIKAYADADWAGDTKDRKSTSGFLIEIFDCPVAWCTKKQPSVSLSSTEAEYIALSMAITETCWIKHLLKDFGYEMTIEINEDNQSVIKIAQNNENIKRLKHIDIRYHFILEKVNKNIVKLNYIQSTENTADLFTKPLGKQLFDKFKDRILSKLY